MAAEEGQVISCHSLQASGMDSAVGEEQGTQQAEFAKKLPNVIFLKVDVVELRTVSEEWNVEAMPTFVFLKEGKAVDKVVGAKKDELQKKEMYLAS